VGRADGRGRHESARAAGAHGTIFINNTGGIIQAIDGKTGDLIWEQRLGSNTASRGITLYDDKLYIAMSNAHSSALDAKTGKVPGTC
jgi:alcohol dehydrogenase (cytochrome c)